jgi:hypothetical protein
MKHIWVDAAFYGEQGYGAGNAKLSIKTVKIAVSFEPNWDIVPIWVGNKSSSYKLATDAEEGLATRNTCKCPSIGVEGKLALPVSIP